MQTSIWLFTVIMTKKKKRGMSPQKYISGKLSADDTLVVASGDATVEPGEVWRRSIPAVELLS